MQRLIHRKYGEAALDFQEIEIPSLSNGEALLRIKSCCVNRSDYAALSAKPFINRLFTGLFRPGNISLGTDFCAQVELIQGEIEGLKVGDRIMGFHDSGLGSHAENIVLKPVHSWIKIPEKLSYKEAAGSLEGFHYAINFVNKVDLKMGDEVMIHGASGAIGAACLQICKYYGAKVTTTCRGEHFEAIRNLGADHCIDYEKEDFTLSEKRFEYVFDCVGKSSFGKCKNILKDKGIYISSELGKGSQNIFLALLSPLFKNKKVKFPMPLNIDKSLNLVVEMIEKSKFQALIDRSYPFSEIKDAYSYVGSGQKLGNVVIEFEDGI